MLPRQAFKSHRDLWDELYDQMAGSGRRMEVRKVESHRSVQQVWQQAAVNPISDWYGNELVDGVAEGAAEAAAVPEDQAAIWQWVHAQALIISPRGAKAMMAAAEAAAAGEDEAPRVNQKTRWASGMAPFPAANGARARIC